MSVSIKRKRSIDLDTVINIMGVTQINTNTNCDLLDDLIQDFTYSELKTPNEEYNILYESRHYEYNENTIDKFLSQTLKRYQKYIYKIDFEECLYVKDYLEKYIYGYKKMSKEDAYKLIIEIDEIIIIMLDELFEEKQTKKRKIANEICYDLDNDDNIDDGFFKISN